MFLKSTFQMREMRQLKRVKRNLYKLSKCIIYKIQSLISRTDVTVREPRSSERFNVCIRKIVYLRINNNFCVVSNLLVDLETLIKT